jgi:hypothetical protein
VVNLKKLREKHFSCTQIDSAIEFMPLEPDTTHLGTPYTSLDEILRWTKEVANGADIELQEGALRTTETGK